MYCCQSDFAWDRRATRRERDVAPNQCAFGSPAESEDDNDLGGFFRSKISVVDVSPTIVRRKLVPWVIGTGGSSGFAEEFRVYPMRRGDGIAFVILPLDFYYRATPRVWNFRAVSSGVEVVIVATFYGETFFPETVNALAVAAFEDEVFFVRVVGELWREFREGSSSFPAFRSAVRGIKKVSFRGPACRVASDRVKMAIRDFMSKGSMDYRDLPIVTCL